MHPETEPAPCDCQPETWMHPDTAHRGRLLYVALGFLGLDVPPAAMPSGLRALHARRSTPGTGSA